MNESTDRKAKEALLDEYKKALDDLHKLLNELSDNDLVESETLMESGNMPIQKILSHVIRAGFCYIIEIRLWLGENLDLVETSFHSKVEEYQNELQKLYEFSKQLFIDYPNLTLEEHDSENKTLVEWGQTYDLEQLMEHAIVHVLRHRRQIEKIIKKQ